MSSLESLKKTMPYHPLLLGGVALLAGLLLVFGNAVTINEIAARQQEDLQASITQVIPASMHDNDLLLDTAVLHAPLEFCNSEKGIVFYRARLNGMVEAVAFNVTGMGYSGAIEIMIGVAADGEILAVRVISHAETPGLGDKIEVARSDWIKHFGGLSLENRSEAQWHVKKDGGEFDQFSGATITPRAVVRAVHAGLEYFRAHRDEILTAPLPVKEASHG